MIKKILFFLLSILLTSFLVGAQTTIVNLMWLSSVEMPVTLMVLISSLFQDFYMLSLSPSGWHVACFNSPSICQP